MAAVDDLSELVERAAAAERAALASKWKDRADVESVSRRVRRAIIDQHDELRRATGPRDDAMSDRWRQEREAALDRPDPPDTDAPRQTPVTHDEAARAEADAVIAVTLARLALTEAQLAVLQARLARIDAGDAEPEAAAIDGHTPLAGRNAVSRHGPALAHGLRGEISVHPAAQTQVGGEEPGRDAGAWPGLPGLHPAVRMGQGPEVAAATWACGSSRW